MKTPNALTADNKDSRLEGSLKSKPNKGIIPLSKFTSIPADFVYNPLLNSAKQFITSEDISETSY